MSIKSLFSLRGTQLALSMALGLGLQLGAAASHAQSTTDAGLIDPMHGRLDMGQHRLRRLLGIVGRCLHLHIRFAPAARLVQQSLALLQMRQSHPQIDLFRARLPRESGMPDVRSLWCRTWPRRVIQSDFRLTVAVLATLDVML